MAIITIGGQVGAGKTTLSSRLAATLHYEELYMGGLFRQLAAERGMSIETFYAALKNDPALERTVDDQQKKMMSEKDNLVVQGRMAWFFAKESPFVVFNVFLSVSPEVGAARSIKKPEYNGVSLDEVARRNADRERAERERYKTLYGVENFLDPGHYDFQLDTTTLTEDETLAKIVAKLRERIEYDV